MSGSLKGMHLKYKVQTPLVWQFDCLAYSYIGIRCSQKERSNMRFKPIQSFLPLSGLGTLGQCQERYSVKGSAKTEMDV